MLASARRTDVGWGEGMAHASMRPADLGSVEPGGGQRLRQFTGEVGPRAVPAIDEAVSDEQDLGNTG